MTAPARRKLFKLLYCPLRKIYIHVRIRNSRTEAVPTFENAEGLRWWERGAFVR